MTAPRDLSLERLGDRDGRRRPQVGEVAKVGAPLAGAITAPEFNLSYAAIVDAVFTAPGALEWLAELRLAIAAMLAAKDSTPIVPTQSDAIQTGLAGKAPR